MWFCRGKASTQHAGQVPDTRAQQWVKQAEVSILMKLMFWVLYDLNRSHLWLCSLCAGVIVRWASPSFKSGFYITEGIVQREQ